MEIGHIMGNLMADCSLIPTRGHPMLPPESLMLLPVIHKELIKPVESSRSQSQFAFETACLEAALHI